MSMMNYGLYADEAQMIAATGIQLQDNPWQLGLAVVSAYFVPPDPKFGSVSIASATLGVPAIYPIWVTKPSWLDFI